ncbi:aldehyde dehydrogenase family protein [Glycomyces sp. TRM65418]|uniref:aldehyde dehydrogenase family protein n=1 Tax=Glycomyces sp. TRM65418 TaxID=2867006 RepID=UPI001CE5E14B|nr:aldehyde dehydrogenase family protein [Glycomyces sp. TRM65418]MCC3762727.1 aldehyde dehydrogenase family protein [Glycomyces sp. TRM65418]QZD56760.1 aldehyde dehydrogenase family protein [Glycomyces sp. TRM65418]
MSDRLRVKKTYKLYVGGKFPRSESGRSYPVSGPDGTELANAALASRKDARDAVAAARKAQRPWAGQTAYLRGQILYRAAEMLEGRAGQFAEELADATGAEPGQALSTVESAIDRLVHYAGWTDKYASVLGGANPVAGPYFNHTKPEPLGVVAVVAPQDDPLLGLVEAVAPAIAAGNTVVVLASEAKPLPALSFGEVLATSDLPGGVVNLLSGKVAEVAPHLAAHADVNGLDLGGVADADLAAGLEAAAAETLKVVRRPGKAGSPLDLLRQWTEYKTVWHPAGMAAAAGGAY